MEDIAASHRARVSEYAAVETLDDRTWNDLLLDDVFGAIDHTESTLGQHALYHRLRSLHAIDDLNAFEALVDRFSQSAPDRERAQRALFRLRDSHGYNLWWLAKPDALALPRWFAVFPVMALTVLILLALVPAFPPAIVVLAAVVGINVFVHYTMLGRLAAATAAFRQLAPVIATGQALTFLEGAGIDPVVAPMAKNAPRLFRLKTISRIVSGDPLMLSVSPQPGAVFAAELVNVIFDYLNMLIPLTATGLYFGAADLRAHGRGLLDLMSAAGDVDVALSVASLRAGRTDWTRPVLNPGDEQATIVDARHPLVTDAVPNSITLTAGRGVLVTGSNMSGKSTFLRTVGLSAVLSQTIHTCFATEYRAPVYRVRSCIGRSDDLLTGRSYYLVEVESLLGLVRLAETPQPHLFLLDELFRGTNAVERIAAGQAVLLELVSGPDGARPHVALAATHDNELVDLLAGTYVPCHFGDRMTDDGLTFDYRLQTGRATSRNAIALLQLKGAPQRLIDRALARAIAMDAAADHSRRS